MIKKSKKIELTESNRLLNEEINIITYPIRTYVEKRNVFLGILHKTFSSNHINYINNVLIYSFFFFSLYLLFLLQCSYKFYIF